MGLRTESSICRAGRNHFSLRVTLLPCSRNRNLEKFFRSMAQFTGQYRRRNFKCPKIQRGRYSPNQLGRLRKPPTLGNPLPPLLYGAAQAWNGKRINDTSLISGMDQLLFKNQINTASGALIELGKLDQIINSDIPNTSLCWHILFSPLPQKLVKHLKEKHEISQFEAGLTHLQSIRESISTCNKLDSTSLFVAEIALGIELSTHALQKGASLLLGKPWTPMSHKDSLFSKYKSLWLTRARSGGLPESMEILIEAITQK